MGLNERRRDEAVAAALGEADVEWTLHQGGTLLPPGSVLTGKGECYRVYTPYARACREKLRSAPLAAVAAPRPQRRGLERGRAAEPLRRLRPPSDAVRALWPAGEDAAGERLAGFVDEAIESYQGDRDFRRDPARVARRPIWPPACCRPASAARGGGEPGRAGQRQGRHRHLDQ